MPKFKRLDATLAVMIISTLLLVSFMVSVWFKSFVGDIDAMASMGEKIIIIDPGHGGEDAGAIGKGEIYEKDLNLEYALEIGKILSEKGYTVVYTRTEDKMLYSPEENIKGHRKISDLKNRLAVCDGYPNSILVSVHMNSFGASKYSGLQVYYKRDSEDSRRLASSIQESVRSGVQPDNKRQIKDGGDLYLLDNSSVPAVIIECGFMSNEEEMTKLLQKEYKNRLSFSIVCGIIEYIDK